VWENLLNPRTCAVSGSIRNVLIDGAPVGQHWRGRAEPRHKAQAERWTKSAAQIERSIRNAALVYETGTS
jgi:hypothetical protein